MIGLAVSDTLVGGPGAGSLICGEGFDLALYNDRWLDEGAVMKRGGLTHFAPLHISLATGIGVGGQAETDRFEGTEILALSKVAGVSIDPEKRQESAYGVARMV